jgi:acyl-CoA dehydrogenase
VLAATLARHGASGGLMASLFSHNIGLPPIQRHGSAELQAEVIPGVLRGEKIAALAITEPGGGTDVAALRTTAVRDGDEYVVNGEKIFITSGMRADWITAAVRTDPKMKGPMGISMLVIPGLPGPVAQPPGQDGLALLRHRAPALRQRAGAGPLPGGRRGQGLQDDHDQLQRRAPVDGRHGAGFFGTLLRRGAGLGAPAQDLRHGHHRPPGDPPQADGHEDAHRVHPRLARCGDRADGDSGDKSAKGAEWVAQVCLLKNHATQTMQFCADQAVQILGRHGLHARHGGERIYREVKVMMIGGGTEEIMKELASRQLGL